ncbi:MAG: RHS repeat-associated core domain-containing protein [Chloroherpetonaceae bacterium]|nr:RHS repeat-associated core domain-containing protein [Chloroherpetonaceae bacterium]
MPKAFKPSDGNLLDYFYNAEGARIEKAFTVGGNTTRTEYEYGAGGNLIAVYENLATSPTFYYNEVGYLRRADSVRFYYLKDQLGNNRATFSDSAGITFAEINDYFAYGAPRQSWIKSGDGRWKFLGLELDNETGSTHTNARELFNFEGVFNRPDRFESKYPNLSPYIYGKVNPLKYIDKTGDSSVVLVDFQGAGNFGHIGILIQSKDGKWRYYSKNGTNDNLGYSGENSIKPNIGDGPFNSPEEFFASEFNKDSNGGTLYERGLLIPMTKEQDEKAIAGFMEEAGKNYNTTTANCAHAVQRALDNAGVYMGNQSLAGFLTGFIGGPIGAMINTLSPNMIFLRLMNGSINSKLLDSNGNEIDLLQRVLDHYKSNLIPRLDVDPKRINLSKKMKNEE